MCKQIITKISVQFQVSLVILPQELSATTAVSIHTLLELEIL